MKMIRSKSINVQNVSFDSDLDEQENLAPNCLCSKKKERILVQIIKHRSKKNLHRIIF